MGDLYLAEYFGHKREQTLFGVSHERLIFCEKFFKLIDDLNAEGFARSLIPNVTKEMDVDKISLVRLLKIEKVIFNDESYSHI